MSRGVCMTRAPVVRVCGGWGGTHLRYLAVKSAVRTGSYHAAARFLIDADGVGGGGLQESVHRRMADLGGRPSTPAAPSVLRAAPHNHTRGRNLSLSPFTLFPLNPIPLPLAFTPLLSKFINRGKSCDASGWCSDCS